MSFYASTLRGRDGSLRPGHTEALEARIAAQRQGLVAGYTRSRRPIDLAWSSEPTGEEVLGAELRIKRWSRAKKEALIAGDWERLRWLAIPPSERVDGGGRLPLPRPSTE